MKLLCSSMLILLLAAGCSLQANAIPTHQLEWVRTPETATELAPEPPPATTQPAPEVLP